MRQIGAKLSELQGQICPALIKFGDWPFFHSHEYFVFVANMFTRYDSMILTTQNGEARVTPNGGTHERSLKIQQ